MKRVLVIDDEEMYREMVGGVLRHSGYDVLEAESGEKALELVQQCSADVVICDITLGKLDGYGVIERLRMDPATSTLPFIFMTGLSDRENVRKGMELGADDYLTKPFTGEELLTAVETRLSRRAELTETSERKMSALQSSISLALPHELRTPLASILGFAQVLGDENNGLTMDEVVQSGKLIHKAGLRLQRLVENFLTFARIEVALRDPKNFRGMGVSPIGASREIISTACRRIAVSRDRMMDLEMEIQESSLAISGEYLSKIVEELVDNAFKFSVPGKRVKVSTSCVDRRVTLTVLDHGRGMSSRQLSDIGAYVQFDRGLQEQQGTGLGLAIAKGLTEIHNGHMEFDTTPGGGLTVRVHLPKGSKR